MKDINSPVQRLSQKLASGVAHELLFLDRAEAAALLHKTPRQLAAAAADTYVDLPYSVVGNKALYRLSDCLKFIEERQRGR